MPGEELEVVITNPDQIPDVRNDQNKYTSSEWLTRTWERSLRNRVILILTLKSRGIHSTRIETQQCRPLQPSKRTGYRWGNRRARLGPYGLQLEQLLPKTKGKSRGRVSLYAWRYREDSPHFIERRYFNPKTAAWGPAEIDNDTTKNPWGHKAWRRIIIIKVIP